MTISSSFQKIIFTVLISSINIKAELVIKKMVIHGSEAPIYELPAAILGYGESLIKRPKTTIICPEDFTSEEFTKCKKHYSETFGNIYNWNSYYKGHFKGSTFLRSLMADIAISLYKDFLDQVNRELVETSQKSFEVHLKLVGISQGGAIAMLFLEVIKAAQEEAHNQALDKNILSRLKKIQKIKAEHRNISIKKVELFTVAAPVSYESNEIIRKHLKEELLTKHLHLYSEGDDNVVMDPGGASDYWGFLKRRFSVESNNKFVQQSVKIQGKHPNHMNLLNRINENNLECIDKLNMKLLENSPVVTPADGQGINFDSIGNFEIISRTIESSNNEREIFNTSIFRNKKCISTLVATTLMAATIISLRVRLSSFLKNLKK